MCVCVCVLVAPPLHREAGEGWILKLGLVYERGMTVSTIEQRITKREREGKRELESERRRKEWEKERAKQKEKKTKRERESTIE